MQNFIKIGTMHKKLARFCSFFRILPLKNLYPLLIFHYKKCIINKISDYKVRIYSLLPERRIIYYGNNTKTERTDIF